MSKWIKIPLITFASILVLGFLLVCAVQVILSEKTLTKLVNRYATEFVDANVSFGRVKLSLVERFPHISLKLEDVSVTYPHDRFAAQDSLAQAMSRMAGAGRQEEQDTLASIRSLIVALKASDFWEHGTLHVPFVELRSPHIYAKNYGDKANWEIFKSDTTAVEDTSSSELPVIHINRIQLLDSPRVVYTSAPDSLFAAVRARKIVLRSNVRTDSLQDLRGKLSIDTLFVAGRLKKDTVFFGLQTLELRRRPDTVTLKATARAALALASLGRTRVPMEIDAKVVKTDSACYDLTLDKFTLSAFDIPVKAVGSAWYKRGAMGLNMKLGTADEQRLFASLKGSSTPLARGDALYDIDAVLNSDLKGLLALSPQKLPLNADGKLTAYLKGKIRQSQLSMSEFAKADLSGRLFTRHISVEMPQDTIHAFADSLDIRLGAEGKQFREGGKKRRLLTLSAGLDTLQCDYKRAFDISGKRLDIRAFNSAEVLTAKQKQAFYPFAGTVAFKRLRLKDSDGMVVVLRDSRESFSVRPKRGSRQTPILSLRSNTSRIFYRSGADRFRLRNLSFEARAEMTTFERTARRERFLDSLSRVYPEIPRDSLFRHWAKIRFAGRSRSLPDFLSEEDFKKGDIHFSLSETLDKYYKEWNVSGKFNLGRLAVVTPSFPLKTSVSSMGAVFNNNTVSLDSLKIFSGNSDLSVKGKLDNIRRFLRGRAPIMLDVDIQSQKIDGDELMAAWSAGSKISDAVKDSLAALEDDAFDKSVAAIEVEPDKGESELIIIPANLNANLSVAADNISYHGMDFYTINTSVNVRERTARIMNTMATSDIGNVIFEGFYSTRTKTNLKVGLNLSLMDVTPERVTELFPAIDTLMPLLTNFSGLLNADLSVRADMDPQMNILIPTARGAFRLEGSDLQIYDTPQFTKLAKTLMFKNKDVGYVDHLKVEGTLANGKVEIYPFVLSIDKYIVAMSGVQDVSTDFKYHVSLIKSPLLIKFGVDLVGNFDDWDFKLCKARYKDVNVPAFSRIIDEERVSLSKSISSLFNTGVDKVMGDNSLSKAIAEAKKENGYNETEKSSESLSAEELEKLKQAQAE